MYDTVRTSSTTLIVPKSVILGLSEKRKQQLLQMSRSCRQKSQTAKFVLKRMDLSQGEREKVQIWDS